MDEIDVEELIHSEEYIHANPPIQFDHVNKLNDQITSSIEGCEAEIEDYRSKITELLSKIEVTEEEITYLEEEQEKLKPELNRLKRILLLAPVEGQIPLPFN